MKELIEAVKEHARLNYGTDGWDYIVECYEDSEIRDLIEGCETVEEAIAAAGEIMEIKNERREDIQGTAW